VGIKNYKSTFDSTGVLEPNQQMEADRVSGCGTGLATSHTSDLHARNSPKLTSLCENSSVKRGAGYQPAAAYQAAFAD
jgi:hypothetical protein